VTRPVFVIDDLAAGTSPVEVVVDGEEGHHGARVRRLRVGEAVDLVDGAGTRATGTVTRVAADGFAVAVASVSSQPPREPRLVVVQALAKGNRAEAGVEMLTECGVDAVVPWAAERCVVEWRGERATAGAQRWRAVARAATKQARRAWFPEIAELAHSDDVVRLLREAQLGLVLHEEAVPRLSRMRPPARGAIVLVVGPEGGISPAELAAFEQAGALAVRMGQSILRTATAGVAAAAVVLAASGRWDE
jgi:16S rRNA (uracil1498-N3)-methyltransferase